MRLKEIKPGMVIHCKNDDERIALLEEAERLGYVWYEIKQKPTEYIGESLDTIHFYDSGKAPFSAKYKHITQSGRTEGAIEFSDLIIPELTAEEVLDWISEHYRDEEWIKCFGMNYCMDEVIERLGVDNVILKIAQWKADHKKKEPKIETVDICRIIEVLPDGERKYVHEEDLNPDGEVLFKDQIENILKRYCMEHDGEYIAVHEVVSR